jgi:hypothetical protein
VTPKHATKSTVSNPHDYSTASHQWTTATALATKAVMTGEENTRNSPLCRIPLSRQITPIHMPTSHSVSLISTITLPQERSTDTCPSNLPSKKLQMGITQDPHASQDNRRLPDFLPDMHHRLRKRPLRRGRMHAVPGQNHPNDRYDPFYDPGISYGCLVLPS